MLLAVVGLALVNLIWLIPTLQNIRVSASVLALEVAHRVQAMIESDLATTLHNLEKAGDEIANEPLRATNIVQRVLKAETDIERIALVDSNGTETLWRDRSGIDAHPLRSYVKDPYFYIALQGAATFGDITLSAMQEPHTTIAVPIRRNGSVEQVLIADLNLGSLLRAVREVSSSIGHIYIVDRNGFQIAHPDVSEILRRPNFMARPIVQKVIVDGRIADGLAPEDAYVNEEGERVFAVGFPIPIAGLGLIFEQPLVKALAGRQQVLLVAGITTVSGLLMFIFILGSNIRLKRLNTSMRELLQDLENAGKMLVRRDLELTRANTRLEELDQIKSEFVSIAAHQLRTPLTGIRWSYQTILDRGAGGLNSEQRHLLESGLGATLRMVELVDDLLNVARIEEGRFGIHLRKQSLAPLIGRLADRYRELARGKGIAFLYIPAGESVPDVLFDEEKISIVLDNVLDNALKYTEPGGQIFLRIGVKEKHIVIEIADTGIGIPKGQLHRVFTKFFRADNALRLHTAGTGLGLYVVKNILEKHNGTVEIVSTSEKGTTMHITLPAA